jgi:cAMP-binding proteins - catabolite gene activator and regulatory subunit of cAMP-dependent protein kinases
MLLPERSAELKTGQRPAQLNIKTYKPGEVVFQEDTRGRELFIIQEGKIGVYKNTPDGEIELAHIEKGGIIGEMSLLDNMPRSATVKCLETAKLLIINETTFQTALKSVPIWLTSIVRIVVSRLRDANKRVDQATLRDKDRGIAALILLLLPGNKYEFSSQLALDHDLVIVEAHYVCRLKKKETTAILSRMEKRKIISIVEDQAHKKHLCISDLEILQLWEEHLKLKSQKKTFKEINIPEEAIAILSNIVYVSQKEGVETDEGTTLLKSSLIRDLENKNSDHLEKSLLDLKRRNLINIMPSGNNDATLIFEKEVLSRIKKIKEWVPRFEQEIV